jgi:hypothetical protein
MISPEREGQATAFYLEPETGRIRVEQAAWKWL